MIKLVEIHVVDDRRIRLRFSDGSSGVYDFSPFIEARTGMTEPLSDAAYFARAYIELGALAWPNGFDLSAESLRRHLEQIGALERRPAAA
jgi:hypothetical protein